MVRATVGLAVAIALLLHGAIASGGPKVSAAAPAFHLEPVLAGYSRPLYVTAGSHTNRLFVVEQGGRIRVATRSSPSGRWRKAGTFLDLRSRVAGPLVGRGLLGLAFHPRYATNGRFYVFYTRRHRDSRKNGDIVIEEYRRRTSTRADPSSRRRVLVIPHPSEYHFGGWMGFGPDGYLYVSTGDAASIRLGYPQDLGSRLGKILRFDPRNPRGPARYSVPRDNPFVGRAGDDLIWASGLRNPWRASFDRLTGALWIGDVGQSRYEEIDRAAPALSGRGANYGWSMCEGSFGYPPPRVDPPPCEAPGVVPPLHQYQHVWGRCSVTGGYVYRGARQPALQGRYFFGDYCTGRIWSMAADTPPEGPRSWASIDTRLLITSFGEDARGELYVVDRKGTIQRIERDPT
jgi:glucose/arabinose dehydrogenase